MIADISGYTGYVVDSPLEYAEDVLADVTGTITDRLGRLLRVNKVEGDAVFAYAPEGTVDASTVLDAVEECYFAFRARLEGVERSTSCTCAACRKASQLDLKFVVHAGEYVARSTAHGEELTGRDVIVAHRLLKNEVADAFELSGYALLTDEFAARSGLDPAAAGMRPHVERYSDVGEVPVHVADLEARYLEERDRRRVAVSEDDASFSVERVVTGPPPVAWEYLTAPDKRLLWQGADVEEVQEGGRRSTGTWSVCVDGRTRIYEEILDWRPFSYFTETRTSAGGRHVVTTELEPTTEGGTRVLVRGRRMDGRSLLGSRRTARRLRAELARLEAAIARAGAGGGVDARGRIAAGQRQGP